MKNNMTEEKMMGISLFLWKSAVLLALVLTSKPNNISDTMVSWGIYYAWLCHPVSLECDPRFVLNQGRFDQYDNLSYKI